MDPREIAHKKTAGNENNRQCDWDNASERRMVGKSVCHSSVETLNTGYSRMLIPNISNKPNAKKGNWSTGKNQCTAWNNTANDTPSKSSIPSKSGIETPIRLFDSRIASRHEKPCLVLNCFSKNGNQLLIHASRTEIPNEMINKNKERKNNADTSAESGTACCKTETVSSESTAVSSITKPYNNETNTLGSTTAGLRIRKTAASLKKTNETIPQKKHDSFLTLHAQAFFACNKNRSDSIRIGEEPHQNAFKQQAAQDTKICYFFHMRF